jgi:hypothetical protein
LRDAVAGLSCVGGVTVGQASADPLVAARLDAVLSSPDTVDVHYASDGAVEVTLGVPLERLRLALVSQAAGSVRGADALTALIVDARGLRSEPVLGTTVCVGATCYAGPAIWYRDRTAALRDRRLGTRPLDARATSQRQGTFQLSTTEATVAKAAQAAALIVVVGEAP